MGGLAKAEHKKEENLNLQVCKHYIKFSSIKSIIRYTFLYLADAVAASKAGHEALQPSLGQSHFL